MREGVCVCVVCKRSWPDCTYNTCDGVKRDTSSSNVRVARAQEYSRGQLQATKTRKAVAPRGGSAGEEGTRQRERERRETVAEHAKGKSHTSITETETQL